MGTKIVCREQRVTGTMVFLLTGLSVKLAPVLKVFLLEKMCFFLQYNDYVLIVHSNACFIWGVVIHGSVIFEGNAAG